MNPSTSIRDFLDALVHPSARHDPAVAARHVAFMATRLCGSLLALGTFPVLLVWHGVPSALEFLVLAWMIVPIAIVGFLSRTGHFEAALTLSAFALTSVIAMVAAASGGVNSVAVIWLVLVPLEAALWGLRRVVAIAALVAASSVGLLAVAAAGFALRSGMTHGSLLVHDSFLAHDSLLVSGLLSVVIYAVGIVLGTRGVLQAPWCRQQDHEPPMPAFSIADVVMWHGQGGRVIDASANALAVLGVPTAELVGYGLFDRIHVTDRPAWLRALSQAVAGDPGEIEFRLRRSGGVEFMWVEMRCRHFNGKPDGDKECPLVITVMRDITERCNRQNALIAARTEAERANAAKTRFLASMSHELRTPLNAIIGFSDMLQDDAPVDCLRRREYARIISQSGHHLLAITNSMLDMARLETGHFELVMAPFSPVAAIAGSVELLALRAREAGVKLESDVTCELPEMTADRRALTQILINLIANAIKFSDRGGFVTVSATVDGGQVVFVVADAGIGMTADDLASIGRPYFRAAGGKRRGGVGLGLSIVKELVDLHGGTLEASSEPGRGTRMVVRLPVDCERVDGARMRKRA